MPDETRLSLDGFDSKKHSGIISAFRQRYIRPGVFSAEYSKIIDRAFKLRNKSDYDDFYVVSKSDVTAQTDSARDFLNAVTEYIEAL